jgi:hypothetical protein
MLRGRTSSRIPGGGGVRTDVLVVMVRTYIESIFCEDFRGSAEGGICCQLSTIRSGMREYSQVEPRIARTKHISSHNT